MKKVIFMLIAILGLAALTSTGCVRRAYYIEDNPSNGYVLIDQAKVGVISGMGYKYNISTLCKEEGDTLNCKDLCGGDSEYKCTGLYVGPMNRPPSHRRTPATMASPAPAPAPVEEPAAETETEEVTE